MLGMNCARFDGCSIATSLAGVYHHGASSVNFPCGDHPAWFGRLECAIIKAGLDGGKTSPVHWGCCLGQ
jgi:hypothetical protein